MLGCCCSVKVPSSLRQTQRGLVFHVHLVIRMLLLPLNNPHFRSIRLLVRQRNQQLQLQTHHLKQLVYQGRRCQAMESILNKPVKIRVYDHRLHPRPPIEPTTRVMRLAESRNKFGSRSLDLMSSVSGPSSSGALTDAYLSSDTLDYNYNYNSFDRNVARRSCSSMELPS